MCLKFRDNDGQHPWMCYCSENERGNEACSRGWRTKNRLLFPVRPATIKDMKNAVESADRSAILEHISVGKPLDPETYRRIRQRQEAITAELRKQGGEMNIAVELIREVRDES
jgi:hypothetical protein